MSLVLNNVLNSNPRALTEASPNRQSLLQFITAEPKAANGSSPAPSRKGIIIVPDSRANSLVVSAPLDYMPLLGEIIKHLDDTAPTVAKIKVFNLKNADARQMAQAPHQPVPTPAGRHHHRRRPAIGPVRHAGHAGDSRPVEGRSAPDDTGRRGRFRPGGCPLGHGGLPHQQPPDRRHGTLRRPRHADHHHARLPRPPRSARPRCTGSRTPAPRRSKPRCAPSSSRTSSASCPSSAHRHRHRPEHPRPRGQHRVRNQQQQPPHLRQPAVLR